MKILKRLFPAALAAGICLSGMQMQADADALIADDAWWVDEWYVVNSDDVYGYSWNYVMNGGEQEAEYQLYQGNVVYARQAVNRMGINWASCQNTEYGNDPGNVYYGFIDMAYLTPYDEYFAPEPETEPPTEPPTEAPTETSAAEAATVLTTAATAKASAVRLTTVTTEEITEASFSTINNNDSNGVISFVTDNFTLLLAGGIVVLLAVSGALAVALVYYNKKQ